MARITHHLNETTPIVFFYSDEVWSRLATSCFRREPQNRPRAGRIFLWNSLAEMLRNESFMPLMLREIRRIVDGMHGKFWNGYFSLDHSQPVGWASCAPRQNFLPAELREYAPNEHSTCLIVGKDCSTLAPITNALTFSLKVGCWRDGLEANIYSLYPGPCFGQLKGDVTARTGLVLFDREHPGEDLPTQTAA